MRSTLAIEYSRGIEDAWSSVASTVPKVLTFLLILLIGWFVAKAIAKIVDGALERVGFDKAVERGGVKKALDRSKYDASSLLGKIVFYAVFLLVLQMAFGVFGQNPVSDLIASVIAFLPKAFTAIVIVVVAAAIAAAVKEIVTASIGGLSYGPMLAGAASISILVIGGFMALNQVGIAPEIVNGLFYGVLAVVVGSAIIAIGGGGIAPMRAQWEKAVGRIEDEAPRLRDESKGARERIDVRAGELKQQAQQSTEANGSPDADGELERPLRAR